MRQHLSLFLTASFLFSSQGVHGSTLNYDDDNVAAPAVAAASRVPVLNPDDEFSTLPTHVLRQIGDILLENDPKSLGRFLQLSRTTNALKDQIFHTTQTMGTVIIDGKERTVMHYGGANNTKDRVLELLGRQTGNPELFEKDHARDYQNWSKTDLLKLFKKQTLKGALDPKEDHGKNYFKLKTLLTDTSWVGGEFAFAYKGLRLCPPLRDATHLEMLDIGCNQITAIPDVTGLPNLKWLYLHDNQLSTAPVVTGLTNLQMLFLSKNQLITAPDVKGVPNLIGLYLNDNQLSTAPVVTGLTKLEMLYLNCNQLAAAPVVTGLPRLMRLNLSNNQLKVAPDLTGLTNLKRLDLSNNQLKVAPDLTGLTNLKSLSLDSNFYDDETFLETLRGLNRGRGVYSQLEFCEVSKDAEGNKVETRVYID